eukprot:CAMPEP_0182495354 /NCGR_PEP_ID=MMETSP1321-20130603/4149_1 /TAXON_ID=91990 /ORGANISM="Bolidomonas sp., Strain RCC1657" /LENGTH=766 /DNA_ID=CAMNT_0024698705 /DNA_START=616 /DNA_END=2912 /DNA_ORIENTATION=+
MTTTGVGSLKTRGIPLNSVPRDLTSQATLDRNSNAFNIYNPRFVCYLSRFLLTYDQPSRLWWRTSGAGGGRPVYASEFYSGSFDDRKFSEFSESVSVGLCDYFLGPYGSYSSVDVAIAGLDAKRQVVSQFSNKDMKRIKQGVVNLLTLLQARYKKPEQKRHLAILFTFIEDERIQPTTEITSLLGEADDGFIKLINLYQFVDLTYPADSKLPTFEIGPPPALGNEYKQAKCSAEWETVLLTKERRLKNIAVTMPGNGYTSAVPTSVYVVEADGSRRVVGSCIISAQNIARNVNNEVTYPLPLAGIQDDPLRLLPNGVRPYFKVDNNKTSGGKYVIPLLPEAGNFSPRTKFEKRNYRAVDEYFGAVGKTPVSLPALRLGSREYSRLALSGAAATVVCRTLLNPLELAKTKIQLKDENILGEVAKMREKNGSGTFTAEQEQQQQQEQEQEQEPSPSTAAESTTSSVTTSSESAPPSTTEILSAMVSKEGPVSLAQSLDITFLASCVFGSFGFGATELFRRIIVNLNLNQGPGGTDYVALLTAAAAACIFTSIVAAPFEFLRVRSMSLDERLGVIEVFRASMTEFGANEKDEQDDGVLAKIPQLNKYVPFWGSTNAIISRELPFALGKFGAFEVFIALFDATLGEKYNIKVGIGNNGLLLSAVAGACAGVVAAVISHPADLILTLQSAPTDEEKKDWKAIVKELTSRKGGYSNLFLGLPQRSIFFFTVIGLQFLLYDYTKGLLGVGSDDLNLVLDVFYAVRQGIASGLV